MMPLWFSLLQAVLVLVAMALLYRAGYWRGRIAALPDVAQIQCAFSDGCDAGYLMCLEHDDEARRITGAAIRRRDAR